MNEFYVIHVENEDFYHERETKLNFFDEYDQFKREVLNVLSSDRVYGLKLYKLSLYNPTRDKISNEPLIEIKPEIVSNELVFKIVQQK